MEHTKTPFELMRDGYGETQKETSKGEEVDTIKKDNPEDRPLTAVEKMMIGYTPKEETKEEEGGEYPY